MGINFYNLVTINGNFSIYSNAQQTIPVGPTIYLSLTSGIDLTINNVYPTNSIIIINSGATASTYHSAINFVSLSNATVNLSGITLDGVGQTQNYNVMTFYSCNNLTVISGSTKDCGYRQGGFDGKNINVQIISHSFINNAQGLASYNVPTWDGTDSSVHMLNCGFSGCSFISGTAGFGGLGGYLDNTQSPSITGMVKNLNFTKKNFRFINEYPCYLNHKTK